MFLRQQVKLQVVRMKEYLWTVPTCAYIRRLLLYLYLRRRRHSDIDSYLKRSLFELPFFLRWCSFLLGTGSLHRISKYQILPHIFQSLKMLEIVIVNTVTLSMVFFSRSQDKRESHWQIFFFKELLLVVDQFYDCGNRPFQMPVNWGAGTNEIVQERSNLIVGELLQGFVLIVTFRREKFIEVIWVRGYIFSDSITKLENCCIISTSFCRRFCSFRCWFAEHAIDRCFINKLKVQGNIVAKLDWGQTSLQLVQKFVDLCDLRVGRIQLVFCYKNVESA